MICYLSFPLPPLPNHTKMFIILSIIGLALSTFNFGVLPDTQYYSDEAPNMFLRQSEWLCECRDELNISFVSHLGDIVDDHDSKREWHNAMPNFLNFMACEIPFGCSPGNHDKPYVLYNEYLYNIIRSQPGFQLSFPHGSVQNNVQRYALSNGKCLTFLHLEFDPTTTVLAHASAIISTLFKDDFVILVTHSFMTGCSGYQYNPLILDFVHEHCNIILTLNGHIWRCGADNHNWTGNDCGDVVHHIQFDYQTQLLGGESKLKMFQFNSTDNKTCVYTFSPYTNTLYSSKNSTFGFYVGQEGHGNFTEMCKYKPCFHHSGPLSWPVIVCIIFAVLSPFVFLFMMSRRFLLNPLQTDH